VINCFFLNEGNKFAVSEVSARPWLIGRLAKYDRFPSANIAAKRDKSQNAL
jgi:hypothetical protein